MYLMHATTMTVLLMTLISNFTSFVEIFEQKRLSKSLKKWLNFERHAEVGLILNAQPVNVSQIIFNGWYNSQKNQNFSMP